jgi:N-acetyl-alpha-D-muramate 1-phosphate uridylyltransferase
MLPIAILAGGLATRLRPITEKIPKALIEVAGKPFIFHQLQYLRKEGIKKVVLCVGYLCEKIEEEVGNGSKFDLDITYSYDGNFLLGTGGSIKKALPLLDKNFYVLYGDSFLPIHFRPVEESFLKSKKPALMTVILNENKWDKSNVIFKEGLILEYNKKEAKSEMKFIDYGLSVLSKSLFDNYEEKVAFDLADLYHVLSIQNQLAGFEVKERFYEIGSHQGIKETELYLSAN